MIYKIEVYIPQNSLDNIKNALYKINVGNVGKYSHCMTWYDVKSCWTPQPGSQPYLGQIGLVEESDEVKLEFRCSDSELKETISIIKENHPYEEVGINVMPLFDINEII